MFGRKARRELEQQVARLLGINGALVDENVGLCGDNARLQREVRSLRDRLAAAWLDEPQRRNAFQVAVDAAEVVEPRPYVQWHDSHLILLSPRDGMAPIDPPTEPRPAPGEAELTDAEAHVVPCPSCSQPHGDGGVCGTDIKEAA